MALRQDSGECGKIMLTCILFVVGSTNFVTPGCMQATGIVTPNEVVRTVRVPRKYKRSVIPYWRRVVKLNDTIEFNDSKRWIQFDYHRALALKYPNRPIYKNLYKWVQKGNQKRYKFHHRLRVLGVR